MPFLKAISQRPSKYSVAAFGALFLMPAQVRSADLPGRMRLDASGAEAFDPGRFGTVTQYLSGWNVVIGGGARVAPKYEGSDELEITPVPFITARFGDRISINPRGLSVEVFSSGPFSLTARAGYDPGRSEDASTHLRGLGDIDAGAVLGGTLAYRLGPVKLHASLDRTIGGSEGLVGVLGADITHVYNRFLFSAGASATWGDTNHMEAYFGVTPLQSVNSGLAVYKAEAGFKRVDVTASVTYAITNNWLARAQVGVGYLLGDAGDSPVVQEKVQPSAMLMVGYKF